MIAENYFYEILIQLIVPKFQHFLKVSSTQSYQDISAIFDMTKLNRTSGRRYALAKNIHKLTSKSVSGVSRTDPSFRPPPQVL